MIRQHHRWLAILLIILLGLSPLSIANAISFSADDMGVTLDTGYTIVKGTWIAGSKENALLLVGNEAENIMKVAVASRTEDGRYHIVALSDKVLSYDEYNCGGAELLDRMEDGHPYFWYIARNGENRTWKDIYIVVKQDTSGDWIVSGGYSQYYEPGANYSFSTAENPNELIVYDTCCHQIYWPIQRTMSLDHFDFSAIEKICMPSISG